MDRCVQTFDWCCVFQIDMDGNHKYLMARISDHSDQMLLSNAA